MPKKIKFESFKYRFLIAAQVAEGEWAGVGMPPWADFVRSLRFDYMDGVIEITWNDPNPGTMSVRLDEPDFYLRGDKSDSVERQKESGLLAVEDPIKLKNREYFKGVVERVAQSAGYRSSDRLASEGGERIANERAFHDSWADAEDVNSIDVRAANEACTAPEMRYITKRLGDVRGKRMLDMGCGLGEASVYFALLGANVTSSDLSPGMLDAACRLAETNGVTVTPHLSAAEDLQLPPDAEFDIIYAGNLMHHVDIDASLGRMKAHLAPGGAVITWDPVAYNPVINVYRAVATEVRTPDEHPLTLRDIRTFRRHFNVVETRYFWLTTLLIFVLMATVQRRNPNRERFWKVVVQDGHKWRWLYSPLERLDRAVLSIVSPLRLLCWNVVVISTKPRQT